MSQRLQNQENDRTPLLSNDGRVEQTFVASSSVSTAVSESATDTPEIVVADRAVGALFISLLVDSIPGALRISRMLCTVI